MADKDDGCPGPPADDESNLESGAPAAGEREADPPLLCRATRPELSSIGRKEDDDGLEDEDDEDGYDERELTPKWATTWLPLPLPLWM